MRWVSRLTGRPYKCGGCHVLRYVTSYVTVGVTSYGPHVLRATRHVLRATSYGPPDWQLHALHAGLHLVLRCPVAMQASFDGPLLQQRLAAAGFAPALLSKYQFAGETAAGLVIGIANTSPSDLERGLQLIAAVMQQRHGALVTEG